MPELGSPKPKKKPEARGDSREVVSAYSEEGKFRAKKEISKAHVWTVVAIVAALVLFVGIILLFRIVGC